MIKTGLVSITFRSLGVEGIIELVSRAKLQAIEWGGDVHVPHGDIAAARKAARLTREAGLEIAAYGSYYRLAVSQTQGLSFESVLATAAALGAPRIRVWAGGMNSEAADRQYRQKVIDETVRIADLARQEQIKIVFEFHNGTLNNSPGGATKLLTQLNHDNVGTYWQPMNGQPSGKNCEAIDAVLGWIEGIHVFHWWPTHEDRHLLSEGGDDWRRYLQRFGQIKKDIYALIEFVKDDRPENFLLDAQTLKLWLNRPADEKGL